MITHLNPKPLGTIPRGGPRLKDGGPLNPLGIDPIGPPLPKPRPLIFFSKNDELKHNQLNVQNQPSSTIKTGNSYKKYLCFQ